MEALVRLKVHLGDIARVAARREGIAAVDREQAGAHTELDFTGTHIFDRRVTLDLRAITIASNQKIP